MSYLSCSFLDGLLFAPRIFALPEKSGSLLDRGSSDSWTLIR